MDKEVGHQLGMCQPTLGHRLAKGRTISAHIPDLPDGGVFMAVLLRDRSNSNLAELLATKFFPV